MNRLSFNMSFKQMKVNGIILAGGKSTRMGQDKGLIQWKGKYLLEYPLSTLLSVCETCIISANDTQYQQFNLPLIEDIYKDIGPIGGLHAALDSTKDCWNVVLSCDVPFIDTNVVERLLQHIGSDVECVVAVHNGQFEPLVTVFHSSVASKLEDYIMLKEYNIRHIIRQLKYAEVDFSKEEILNPALFQNIDTPEDLEKLQ
ncbi:molybdenum cofactor guanylyltransferase [Puteibacter caeruleilacunae]|nr:molybdenum cofactor guanylyltransferase [Puteibacter caeruleilacunae]